MTREHVSLAIYNAGASLIREKRRITLGQGLIPLNITDVTEQIDATSVTLHAQHLTVLEQNYQYDLVDTQALLRRYLEHTIEVITEDGNLFTGQLLSANTDDIILRQDDGQVIVIHHENIRNLSFTDLPDGLITRPTLRWLLHSTQSGEHLLDLTYLSYGLNWSADYNVLLGNNKNLFDINGWVTITNNSGTTFPDAQVKLVAGDVERLPQRKARGANHYELAMAMPPTPEPVAQREIFEYQLYEINRAVTVSDRETKQVEFIARTGAPCTVVYTYEPSVSLGYHTYGSPVIDQLMQTNSTNVKTWLEFSTAADTGLDADLPAGRIRVYQADTDGSAVLIGENHIEHTPKGETIRFELGRAFDLVGERTQTDYQLRGKNTLTESYCIRLRNRKDSETVQIRVRETLFRWSNWQIMESNVNFKKVDSHTIEFVVDVAPSAEQEVRYTVRYTW